jgi:hypothetical protein
MNVIELFRYKNDGRIIITPNKELDTDAPDKYRLIADEGMELTDGDVVADCIDIPCERIDEWHEVEKPIADSEALAIIVGGGSDA